VIINITLERQTEEHLDRFDGRVGLSAACGSGQCRRIRAYPQGDTLDTAGGPADPFEFLDQKCAGDPGCEAALEARKGRPAGCQGTAAGSVCRARRRNKLRRRV
jgi:hypothetical protein